MIAQFCSRRSICHKTEICHTLRLSLAAWKADWNLWVLLLLTLSSHWPTLLEQYFACESKIRKNIFRDIRGLTTKWFPKGVPLGSTRVSLKKDLWNEDFDKFFKLQTLPLAENGCKTLIKIVIADFDILWLGSTASEREGVFYHLSQNDHPAFGLNSDPKRLTTGYSHVVGITRKKVIFS